ncbi:hypothetical protein GCM10010247_59420 [Streptomyces calvus]|nr:hypothetical protein GCM10010247_59420 [Streptomyces calvus]
MIGPFTGRRTGKDVKAPVPVGGCHVDDSGARVDSVATREASGRRGGGRGARKPGATGAWGCGATGAPADPLAEPARRR